MNDKQIIGGVADQIIDEWFDGIPYKEREPLYGRLNKLASVVAKAIDAEAERRFQAMCHDSTTADVQRFCDGCEKYQTEKFGSSPITTLRARVAELEGKNDGVSLIAAERARQVSQEGWTLSHDDAHVFGELGRAADCYITSGLWAMHEQNRGVKPDGWPWERDAWKPSSDQVRNLVKAGALIAAEIDRLKRLATDADPQAGRTTP